MLIWNELKDQGLAEKSDLARVQCSMVVDIGGGEVEEIALSIAAQLVVMRRGKVMQHGKIDG